MTKRTADGGFVTLDYNSLWAGFSEDLCYPVFLSPRDINAILIGLEPLSWPSRWVDSGSGMRYPGNRLDNLGDTSKLEAMEQFVACLERKLVESMGCTVAGLDRLAVAIEKIAAAMQGSSRCCGSVGTPGGPGTGGSGSTSTGPVPPAGDPGTDPPPDGYDTWDEYHADVCAKTNWLIDTIIADFDRMSTLQLAGATAIGILPILATLLLDPIPGDELLVLAGLLVAMAYYGSETLGAIRDAISDGKDDIVCAIYNSSGAEDAKTAALSAFDTALNNSSSDPIVQAYGHQVFQVVLSWDGLNKVFTKDDTRTYTPADCSECVGCGQLSVTADFGTIDSVFTDEDGYVHVRMTGVTNVRPDGYPTMKFHISDTCSMWQVSATVLQNNGIGSPSAWYTREDASVQTVINPPTVNDTGWWIDIDCWGAAGDLLQIEWVFFVGNRPGGADPTP